MLRKILWYFGGRKVYTRAGFEKAAESFDESLQDVDLSGLSFVVTGANSGIGFCCSKYFAAQGGTVHLICRNPERGEHAKETIVKETSNNNVHLHILDMANTKEVEAWARQCVDENMQVDVLINNAGCMVHERNMTPLNIEYNFAVNTFGPYVLTMELMPLLSKSKDGRVIFVSSGGMLLEKLNASDPQLAKVHHFDGIVAYSQHKRQQVVMASYFSETITSVRFFSMHPGWADTPSVATSLPDFYEKMKDELRTEQQGSDTVQWLASSQNIPDTFNGNFIFDRQIAPQHLFLGFTTSSKSSNMAFMTYLEDLKEILVDCD
eukprot:m.137843 g.137843  ORF g.137843 m.137843 type:complete len:321 (+) comp12460_c0_seq1:99-1061(+)